MHFARFRRTMMFCASAFGVALVLAACGSSSKSTTAATSGTTAATSATTAASPSSSAASNSPISAANSSKGQILVDAHGKSLYVFDKDTASTITCVSGNGCTGLWPPLVVPSGSSAPSGVSGVTATLGTVTRPDGTTQLTSDGRTLYTYNGDPGPGSTNGDGFMGIWHVAKVTGNGSAPGASSGSSGTSTTSASGY
jgi:predicted lipoprotein with Yx(FWY)xxD motif